jgi:hypothetical protein
MAYVIMGMNLSSLIDLLNWPTIGDLVSAILTTVLLVHMLAWEVMATFNPGAARNGGVIHILYRAVNEHNISSLGHATTDGETIVGRSLEPALAEM